MKQSYRVAAAADTGDEQVGKALFTFEDLAAGFYADDAVKIAHNHRERV